MPLDYGSFLTPFASPALGRIDVSGLEDAGRMLEQRAQYDQSRADRLAKEARDYELEKQHRDASDEYYRMEAETHRMNQQNAKNAANEKRTQALFDAFRKAKTPTDRKAIMDELKRLGFTVEEQASEFQGASPVQASKAPIAPTPEKAAMGLIDSYDMPQAKGERSALEMRNYDPVLGVAGAGAMSGEAGGATAGVDIQEPAGKGKFVIKDKSGIAVHSYDEPLELAKSRMIMNSAMGGLKEAARTDRERTAAEAAVNAAADLVPAGATLEQYATAAKFGLDMYGKAVAGQGYRRTYEPAKGGGGPASTNVPTRLALKVGDQALTAYNMIHDNIAQDQAVKGANERYQSIQRGMSLLKASSEGGMSEHAALKEYLNSISGKVVTDTELDKMLGSAGAWQKWLYQANQYLDSGRMPENFKRQLEGMLVKIGASAERTLDAAAENARNQFLNLPLGMAPDDQEALADTLGSSISPRKFKAHKAAKGAPAKAGAPSAPSGPSKEQRLDDFLGGK